MFPSNPSTRPAVSGFVVAFALCAAASADPVKYSQNKGSSFYEGCFDPCLCFVAWIGTPQGTFTLDLIDAGPISTTYAVEGIDWKVPEIGWSITGSGTYTVSGKFVYYHQMKLELSVNGQPPQPFDSGLVEGGLEFPDIGIEINRNKKECFDTVIVVDAAPAAPAGDLDGDGCVGQSDLGILLSCYEAGDCGDLDGDGKTTQSDLGILLGNYGAGCR